MGCHSLLQGIFPIQGLIGSPALQADSSLSEPPGNLPNPGTEPGSPALQADSSLSEPPGKPLLTSPGVFASITAFANFHRLDGL